MRRRLALAVVALLVGGAFLGGCGGGDKGGRSAEEAIGVATTNLPGAMAQAVFNIEFLDMQQELRARNGDRASLSPPAAAVLSHITKTLPRPETPAFDPATSSLKELQGLDNYRGLAESTVNDPAVFTQWRAAIDRIQALLRDAEDSGGSSD